MSLSVPLAKAGFFTSIVDLKFVMDCSNRNKTRISVLEISAERRHCIFEKI